jgi:uncharacterized membrane protein
MIIEMTENRSSVAVGARRAVMAWAASAVALSDVLLLLGAWLVALFELAMMAGLCAALEAHGRRLPRRERLTFERGLIHHEVVDASGRISRRSLAQPICRIELGRGDAHLALIAFGGSARIGACLGAVERRQLALLLGSATGRSDDRRDLDV